MGRRRDQLEILLAKKDEQIEILESRIQAYTTRVSQLQTRLLSTLDALDQVKSLQEQELVPVEHENALLKAQLNQYLAVVKAAEAERDDMRDAVLKLVEKVEVSSDYSKWPRSQIQLASLSASLSHPLPKPLHSSEDHLLSYASTILASLRLERDNERRAHARTRDLAEKRILRLEAQLSRREFELERCIVGGHVHDAGGEGDKTPRQRTSPSATAPPVDTMEQLGNEEIISILDSTVARNKILEGEVKTLVRRLEEARASTSQTSNILNLAARVQDSPPNYRSDQRSREPAQMDNNFQGRDDEDTRESIILDHPFVDHQLLQDLDHQIRELGRKVDAFAEERRNIRQTLPSISTVQNSDLPDHDQRIRDLERQCERLRRSEDHLRDELDVVRADAHAREDDLLERIRELEDMRGGSQEDELLMTNMQVPTQIEPEPPDLLDPFGTDDGELSMELATPLMPTNVIDINGDLRSNNLVNQLEPLPSQARSFPPAHLHLPDPTLFGDAAIQAGGNPVPSTRLHGNPYPESYVATADDPQYYVDPPSIPLPPSPPGMQDGDRDRNHDQHDDADADADAFRLDDDEGDDDPGGDSPTLSQIDLETSILDGEMSALTRQLSLTPPGEVFVAELIMDDVELQLGAAQRAVEVGEVALERLEGLVRELHPL